MISSVTIVEVLERAQQGITKPFLCRGDDDRLYYVKGRAAGCRSLCCEWIAGNLARDVGLPIPEFLIAEVPETLVRDSSHSEINDLGSGFVFASLRVEGAQEITWPEAQGCKIDEKALVLIFDWWVQNEDRSLSVHGGNPNLLTTPYKNKDIKLWVFDFNLAFDLNFSEEKFRSNHLFYDLLSEWPLGFRQNVTGKMKVAVERLNELFAALPEEWLYFQGDKNLAVHLDKNLVSDILSIPFTEPDRFWKSLL